MTASANQVAVVRAKLKFTSREEFIKGFTPLVTKAGLFIRTRSTKPEGTGIRFEFKLADDSPVFVGEGVVRKEIPFDQAQPQRPCGMLVALRKLNRASKTLLDEMLAAKDGGSSESSEEEDSPVEEDSVPASAAPPAAPAAVVAPAPQAAAPSIFGGGSAGDGLGSLFGDDLDDELDDLFAEVGLVSDGGGLDFSGPADLGGSALPSMATRHEQIKAASSSGLLSMSEDDFEDDEGEAVEVPVQQRPTVQVPAVMATRPSATPWGASMPTPPGTVPSVVPTPAAPLAAVAVAAPGATPTPPRPELAVQAAEMGFAAPQADAPVLEISPSPVVEAPLFQAPAPTPAAPLFQAPAPTPSAPREASGLLEQLGLSMTGSASADEPTEASGLIEQLSEDVGPVVPPPRHAPPPPPPPRMPPPQSELKEALSFLNSTEPAPVREPSGLLAPAILAASASPEAAPQAAEEEDDLAKLLGSGPSRPPVEETPEEASPLSSENPLDAISVAAADLPPPPKLRGFDSPTLDDLQADKPKKRGLFGKLFGKD